MYPAHFFFLSRDAQNIYHPLRAYSRAFFVCFLFFAENGLCRELHSIIDLHTHASFWNSLLLVFSYFTCVMAFLGPTIYMCIDKFSTRNKSSPFLNFFKTRSQISFLFHRRLCTSTETLRGEEIQNMYSQNNER